MGWVDPHLHTPHHAAGAKRNLPAGPAEDQRRRVRLHEPVRPNHPGAEGAIIVQRSGDPVAHRRRTISCGGGAVAAAQPVGVDHQLARPRRAGRAWRRTELRHQLATSVHGRSVHAYPTHTASAAWAVTAGSRSRPKKSCCQMLNSPRTRVPVVFFGSSIATPYCRVTEDERAAAINRPARPPTARARSRSPPAGRGDGSVGLRRPSGAQCVGSRWRTLRAAGTRLRAGGRTPQAPLSSRQARGSRAAHPLRRGRSRPLWRQTGPARTPEWTQPAPQRTVAPSCGSRELHLTEMGLPRRDGCGRPATACPLPSLRAGFHPPGRLRVLGRPLLTIW